MTARARKPKALSLRDAYETEYARRAMERRKADEELRARQARDEAGATSLLAALNDDAGFLADHGLTADRRGYQVTLDHAGFRIAAYFEGGRAAVSCSRRSSGGGLSALKQDTAEGVEDALALIAKFLADEIR